MATSSTPRRSNESKKSASQYHERNRTFSSTTTNHYKSKLAQIGIQKDLREILERKKLEKELEKNNSSPSSASQNEESKVSRKVRFVEGKIPIRRSKSFTSGTKTNDENHSQNFNEKIPPKKFNKSFKGKRKEFFDLQKPTNIKIELQTNSGERKCILDENVALANVKCDLRNCRNILNHNDIKEKTFSYPNIEKKKEKHKSQNFYQVGDKSQSLTKKKSVCVSETIKTASSAVTKAEEMAKDEEKQLEEKFTKVAIDDSN